MFPQLRFTAALGILFISTFSSAMGFNETFSGQEILSFETLRSEFSHAHPMRQHEFTSGTWSCELFLPSQSETKIFQLEFHTDVEVQENARMARCSCEAQEWWRYVPFARSSQLGMGRSALCESSRGNPQPQAIIWLSLVESIYLRKTVENMLVGEIVKDGRSAETTNLPHPIAVGEPVAHEVASGYFVCLSH